MGPFGTTGIQRLEYNGPIQCNRHWVSHENMGPFDVTSIMFLRKTWAHSILLQLPLSSGTGPIQCNRHRHYAAVLGPFNPIGIMPLGNTRAHSM